jgi:hypothetical protein
MPRSGVVESTAMSDALTRDDEQQLVDRLRELVGALDARMPHLRRTGEVHIAGDAPSRRTRSTRSRDSRRHLDRVTDVQPQR